MHPSVLAVWILIALYLLYLLYICRDHVMRLHATGWNVNYGISDIWASIFGLTPTLLLIGALPKVDASHEAYLLLIFFGCAQLVGMFIARVDYLTQCNLDHVREQTLESAGNILVGAIFFSVGLLAGFAVAFFLLPATVAYLVCYGFGDVQSPRKRKALPL